MPDIIKTFSKVDMTRVFRNLTHIFFFIALTYNIAGCWEAYRHKPLREAASRSLMASNSSFFYDSGLAEPVPVFALKVPMAFGADPDAAIRAGGLAVYALCALLTLFILRRRFGELAGGIGALVFAANPYAGYYAALGSSHLYALLFLLLFWYYFDSPEWTFQRAAFAGAAGGLACLSRLDAALFLAPAALLTAACRGRAFNFKAAGLALGLAAVLVLPYLAYQRVVSGNMFYAQELGLRRWANLDLYGYTAPPSRPSGPLSPAAFLFRNGAAGAFQSAASGLGRAFAYEIPRSLYYNFFMVLVFRGGYWAFALKKDSLLVFFLAALVPVLPLAAIRQIPSTGGIELRYYLWTLWALCALAGLGLQETITWLEKNSILWLAGQNGEAGKQDGGNGKDGVKT